MVFTFVYTTIIVRNILHVKTLLPFFCACNPNRLQKCLVKFQHGKSIYEMYCAKQFELLKHIFGQSIR